MRTIKIRVLGLVMSLVLTMGAFAQDFNYGIKGGANFAVQSEIGDIYKNNDIKTGLHVGVFGNLELGKNVSLQTEVNYEQKGSKTETITSKYDYISVPVLVKYSLGKSDNTSLEYNFNVGPYASFLVKAENEIEGASDGLNNTIDVKDDTENLEFGLITGFGVEYPLGDNNLILDLRFGLGLSSFDKDDTDVRNKYVGVSLGYEF